MIPPTILRRANQQASRFAARLLALSLCAALTLCAATPTVGTADAQRYINDIKALTTPKMEGRGDGTKGLSLAAHLIEARFKQLRLKPAGTHGFYQPFDVITGQRLKPENTVRAEYTSPNGQSAVDQFKLDDDFVPLNISSSGRASAPLVFAGYGITAPDHDYDDYAGLDVKGKIVIAFLDEPPNFAPKTAGDPHASPIPQLTHHAYLITKAINARNHGAAALILVNRKMAGAPEVLPHFSSIDEPENSNLLCLQTSNALAEKWFRASGKSLDEIQKGIDATGKPAPPSAANLPGVNVTLSIQIETIHATVNNILAYLPGKTDEYIIIGAHYDHLGRGDAHSMAPSLIGQIHPGADDNASGTAGVLELARLLAPLQGQLQRGILFSSFAGEELGLLGSAAWVKNPTLPLDKAAAMLNMDMIGRIKDNKVYIGGVGTGSTFKSILETAAKPTSFKIEYSSGGYASSDHTSFVVKHIPVLFFFSGLHADYHKPSDTWEKIDPNSAAHLLDVIANVSEQIADAPERPAFQVVVEDNPHAGSSSASSTGGGGGYGPYFGSIPDFGQTEDGVRFSDVKPGSPAAKAGFRAGDVLVKFGEKPIKNLYDFTDALRRSKVGDVVQVTVLRDGQQVTAAVTLEQRK
jgi:peptidase M28-like protein/PDZ domain-containing protein/PA domain-containing protein